MRVKKDPVETFEYRGGYALVSAAELRAVIEGYRDGKLRKDDLRLFAARIEKRSLHQKSKVEISRILNCKATKKGIKRVRRGLATRAGENVDSILRATESENSRLKAVSRLVIRAIAQGRTTCNEAIVLLMYALRRIDQKRALKRLLPKERYARFTYGELSELSGIPKANISRSVQTLKTKGFLSTVWVVKQNENQFGLLFVDGPTLTFISGAAQDRSQPERKKTTTPPDRNNIAPVIEMTTLRKIYPKSEIQEIKVPIKEKLRGVASRATEWERIKARAEAMRENWVEEVA